MDQVYRINLYREYFEKKRRARAQMLGTGLAAGVIGIEILLIGTLAVSAVLLGEQTRDLREEVARLNTRLQAQATPRPEIETARQILELRQSRVDWSPKLAGLADGIDRSLIVLDLTGQAGQGGRPSQLALTGTVRSSVGQMEAVARFMEALRSDRRIKSDLPEVKLGTLEGAETGKFEVICSAPVGGP
jgi:hypothetical protein